MAEREEVDLSNAETPMGVSVGVLLVEVEG
jgi:hypothetical protein